MDLNLHISQFVSARSRACESEHIPFPKRRKTISTNSNLDESRGTALPKAVRTYQTGKSFGAVDAGENHVANDPSSQ
jgi:hypothetical protein